MGLTPVIWSRISATATFDTGGKGLHFSTPITAYLGFTTDFNIHGGTISVSEVLYNWENIVSNASARSTGFIVLEHDLFQQTVEVATGYILPDALAHQFIIKPVVECLNLPMSDAYIELNNNSTNPPVIEEPGAVTLTATPSGFTLATGKARSGSLPILQNIPGVALAITNALAGLAIGMAAVF